MMKAFQAQDCPSGSYGTAALIAFDSFEYIFLEITWKKIEFWIDGRITKPKLGKNLLSIFLQKEQTFKKNQKTTENSQNH